MKLDLSAPVDVRAIIKSYTDLAHSRLHVHPVSRAVMGGTNTRALRAMLQANLALLRAVRSSDPCNDGLFVDEIAALECDLKDVPKPNAMPLAPVDQLGLGARYVVYGSQFGRKSIQRHVHAWYPNESQSSYLALPADRQGWEQTLRELQSHSEDTQTVAQLSKAACTVFVYFEGLMDICHAQQMRFKSEPVN